VFLQFVEGLHALGLEVKNAVSATWLTEQISGGAESGKEAGVHYLEFARFAKRAWDRHQYQKWALLRVVMYIKEAVSRRDLLVGPLQELFFDLMCVSLTLTSAVLLGGAPQQRVTATSITVVAVLFLLHLLFLVSSVWSMNRYHLHLHATSERISNSKTRADASVRGAMGARGRRTVFQMFSNAKRNKVASVNSNAAPSRVDRGEPSSAAKKGSIRSASPDLDPATLGPKVPAAIVTAQEDEVLTALSNSINLKRAKPPAPTRRNSLFRGTELLAADDIHRIKSMYLHCQKFYGPKQEPYNKDFQACVESLISLAADDTWLESFARSYPLVFRHVVGVEADDRSIIKLLEWLHNRRSQEQDISVTLQQRQAVEDQLARDASLMLRNTKRKCLRLLKLLLLIAVVTAVVSFALIGMFQMMESPGQP
jgi:hypothetical protein